MADQLSAQDWLDQGLKTLAKSGFTALKAEPLAKAMGVSRGSFYWHFADIGAFHAAILKHWREVAAEQIIASVEAAAKRRKSAALLLRRAFGEQAGAGERGPQLGQRSIRTARAAVQAIDRRRLELYRKPARRSPALPPSVARARAQILYWAFFGFALSDQPLPKAQTAGRARRDAADGRREIAAPMVDCAVTPSRRIC